MADNLKNPVLLKIHFLKQKFRIYSLSVTLAGYQYFALRLPALNIITLV